MATDLAEFVGAAVALNLLFGVPLLPAGLITAGITVALLALRPGAGCASRPSMTEVRGGANAGSLRHVGLRNTVVNAWLHRPLRSALRWTVFSLADAPKNRDFLRGLALIRRAVPWIVRERAPMPAGLDADLRLLDERRFRVRRRFLTFREDLGRSAYP